MHGEEGVAASGVVTCTCHPARHGSRRLGAPESWFQWRPSSPKGNRTRAPGTAHHGSAQYGAHTLNGQREVRGDGTQQPRGHGSDLSGDQGAMALAVEPLATASLELPTRGCTTPSDHVGGRHTLHGAFSPVRTAALPAPSMITITSIGQRDTATHSVHVVDGLTQDVARALAAATPNRLDSPAQLPASPIVPHRVRTKLPLDAMDVLHQRQQQRQQQQHRKDQRQQAPATRSPAAVVPGDKSLEELQRQFGISSRRRLPQVASLSMRQATRLSSSTMSVDDLRFVASTHSLYRIERKLTPRAAAICMRYMRDKVRQGVPPTVAASPSGTTSGVPAVPPHQRMLHRVSPMPPTRQAARRLQADQGGARRLQRGQGGASSPADDAALGRSTVAYHRASPHSTVAATRNRIVRQRMRKFAGVRFHDNVDPGQRARDAIARHRADEARRARVATVTAHPEQYRPAPVKVFATMDRVEPGGEEGGRSSADVALLHKNHPLLAARQQSHSSPLLAARRQFHSPVLSSARAVLSRPVSRRSPRGLAASPSPPPSLSPSVNEASHNAVVAPWPAFHLGELPAESTVAVPATPDVARRKRVSEKLLDGAGSDVSRPVTALDSAAVLERSTHAPWPTRESLTASRANEKAAAWFAAGSSEAVATRLLSMDGPVSVSPPPNVVFASLPAGKAAAPVTLQAHPRGRRRAQPRLAVSMQTDASEATLHQQRRSGSTSPSLAVVNVVGAPANMHGTTARHAKATPARAVLHFRRTPPLAAHDVAAIRVPARGQQSSPPPPHASPFSRVVKQRELGFDVPTPHTSSPPLPLPQPRGMESPAMSPPRGCTSTAVPLPRPRGMASSPIDTVSDLGLGVAMQVDTSKARRPTTASSAALTGFDTDSVFTPRSRGLPSRPSPSHAHL